MKFAKTGAIIAVAVILIGMIWASQQNYLPASNPHCRYEHPHHGLVLFTAILNGEVSHPVIQDSANTSRCAIDGVTDANTLDWIFNNGWDADLANATGEADRSTLPTVYEWRDGYTVTNSAAGRFLKPLAVLHTMLASFAFVVIAWRNFKGSDAS